MSDLKGLQKELDDMEKALEVPDAGEEEPRTDPPSTEAPKTQPPPTEAPKTEAPKTEPPPTEAPRTEAPPTEAPTTEPPEDPRDKEMREMREEIERLKKKGPATKPPPTAPPPTEPPISEENFLGEADLDELTRDPKLFNQLLNKIYKKAREDARVDMRRGNEGVVRAIPDILKNQMTLTAKLKAVNKKFYEDNEDLVAHKDRVALVFEEFIDKNPDKKYDELLPDVATEVRKRYNLQKKATQGKAPAPPNLPHKKKGAPRQSHTPDTDPLLKEIDEMDEEKLGL